MKFDPNLKECCLEAIKAGCACCCFLLTVTVGIAGMAAALWNLAKYLT